MEKITSNFNLSTRVGIIWRWVSSMERWLRVRLVRYNMVEKFLAEGRERIWTVRKSISGWRLRQNHLALGFPMVCFSSGTFSPFPSLIKSANLQIVPFNTAITLPPSSHALFFSSHDPRLPLHLNFQNFASPFSAARTHHYPILRSQLPQPALALVALQ